MRVRSVRPVSLELLVLAALAPAAAAQDAEKESPSDALVAADALQWQALANELFVSGERGIADPGGLEPEARHVARLGPVELLPRLDEELVWDDNVFLTDRDPTDDLILRSRLGALADWPLSDGGHRLTAGYEMARHRYLGGEAQSFVEQLASAQLELNFRRLRLTVGDRFEDRTDPILAVFTGKVERTINTLYGVAGWHEESSYLEAKAQGVTTSYDDPAFQGFDRVERLAHAEVGWRGADDCWTFVRAGVLDRSFDRTQLNDMTGASASAGIRLRRAPALDASIRAGFRLERFDDVAATDRRDRAINADAEARAFWWPTRASGIDARYVHTTEFSPVSNYQRLDRAELGWTQMLTGRVRSRAGVGLEHVDPSAMQDRFWRYVVGAGLAWRALDFADVTLQWRMRVRATDVPNGDYVDQQLSLGVAVRL